MNEKNQEKQKARRKKKKTQAEEFRKEAPEIHKNIHAFTETFMLS
jgi:hypothetical protein